MRAFLIFSTLLMGLSFSAHAIVDMKSANYSETWTDIIVPGVGYDLRLNRGYNSRSLFNGLFGFGWCSDYETKIDVTAESNLKLTECGGGVEVLFAPRGSDPRKVGATIGIIMKEIRKRRPELKKAYLNNLEKELHTNDFMREEFSRRLEIKGKVADGTVYLANGKEAETITLKGGVYKRTLVDGTYQLFDSSGRMTHMYDKNNNYLKLAWERGLLQTVSDNLGRKLTFKYNATTKRVSEIVGPNGLKAKYVGKGEDLVEVRGATGKKYRYAYDDLHNLTKITYDDSTYKSLTYNKDKDWVTSFRNAKGCVETYDYHMSKKDPQNHFWSLVEKKCGTKVTNRSKYEFFHRPRPKGTGVYLYRVRTEVNKSVTDIVYHETFGKPLSILRDNRRTEYSYYSNGMVRTKREPGRHMAFEYKNSCKKLSQLTMDLFEEIPVASSKKGRKTAEAEKPVKSIKTNFTYERAKCNLVAANTSEGQKVKLKYDTKGRISEIEDQSKKLVKIKYESRFGKPSVVTRPGLGTIQVTYKPDGEILKVESKEGASIAVQVAGIFNNLLDIIAPATSEVSL